jgi:hypothetical protein
MHGRQFQAASCKVIKKENGDEEIVLLGKKYF